jgi:hypothetical protein
MKVGLVIPCYIAFFPDDNARASADSHALLDTFAAELPRAAGHVALRHGAAGAWLDLR